MPRVGGQRCDRVVDVDAIPVSLEDPPACERVTQIVDARMWKGTVAPPPEPLSDLAKGAAHRGVRHWTSSSTNDEPLGHAGAGFSIPMHAETTQVLHHGIVDRHQPRLSELGLPDPEYAAGKVGISPMECEGFGDAEASAREKTEESLVRVRSQGVGRVERGRRLQQLPHLLVGVDVRLAAPELAS